MITVTIVPMNATDPTFGPFTGLRAVHETLAPVFDCRGLRQVILDFHDGRRQEIIPPNKYYLTSIVEHTE